MREFLTRIPVWPIWSLDGGLVDREAEEVATILPHAARELVRGGIVMRPASGPETSEQSRSGSVITVTLGTEGPALRDGLQSLTDYLVAVTRRATL